jgi:hypothetical protein
LILKRIIGVALFVLALSQPASANDAVGQAPQATLFVKKGGGLFGVPAPWQFGKAGPDKFWMRQLGNNVTSGARLDQLARLQTAAYALQKGYGYYAFVPTKHMLWCNTLYTGDATADPMMMANIKMSKVPGPGLDDAKAILSKLVPILSADAPEAEKDGTFAFWSASCVSTIKPGFKNLFKKLDFGRVTVNGTVFEIQR